jgi:hypothetical protein
MGWARDLDSRKDWRSVMDSETAKGWVRDLAKRSDWVTDSAFLSRTPPELTGD